jgi:hypothetical protein
MMDNTYSNQDDIRDGFLRRHSTDYDHVLARDFVDEAIPDRDDLKRLPLAKELSVAFASYHIGFRMFKKRGDIYYQKRAQYERRMLDKRRTLIDLRDKDSNTKPSVLGAAVSGAAVGAMAGNKNENEVME